MNKNIISIIGKTNVGKSTLINNLSKKKISITTNKKNTTISCVTSIINNEITLIDTPGPIIKNEQNNKNKSIYEAIDKSNKLLILIDNIFLTSEDFFILDLIKKHNKYTILILNKIDKIKKKITIIPFITKIKKKYSNIIDIIPISNTKKINIEELKKKLNIQTYKNTKKINNINSFILETTRETLLNKLEKELPYIIKINILNEKLNKYSKFILLELLIKKYSQKKIIIGKDGKKIKDIITDIKNKLMKKLNQIEKIKIIINIK